MELKESKVKMALFCPTVSQDGEGTSISFEDPPLVKPVVAKKHKTLEFVSEKGRENNFCPFSCVSEGCSLRRKDSSKILDYLSGKMIHKLNEFTGSRSSEPGVTMKKTILIAMSFSFERQCISLLNCLIEGILCIGKYTNYKCIA